MDHLHTFVAANVSSAFSDLIGYVFPAYCSIKAIETPKKEDDKQWLTYWMVFGLFTVIEYFSGFIMDYLFSYYFVFKFFFILWLIAPMYNVSSVHTFLCLVFSRYSHGYVIRVLPSSTVLLFVLSGAVSLTLTLKELPRRPISPPKLLILMTNLSK